MVELLLIKFEIVPLVAIILVVVMLVIVEFVMKALAVEIFDIFVVENDEIPVTVKLLIVE